MDFDEDLVKEAKIIDKKLLDFYESLIAKIKELTESNFTIDSDNKINNLLGNSISLYEETEKEIYEGIADNLDLNRGLQAILNLSKSFNSLEDHNLLELIKMKHLLGKWLDAMGLLIDNRAVNEFESKRSFNEDVLLDKMLKFRHSVREKALINMKTLKNSKLENDGNKNDLLNNSKSLLSLCDNLRSELDEYGIKIKVRMRIFVFFYLLNTGDALNLNLREKVKL